MEAQKMKNIINYIFYTLSVASMIIFFIGSYNFETIVEYFPIIYAFNIVLYFVIMFVNGIDNTFEFVCEIIIFLAFNFIGLSLTICTFSFFPYSGLLLIIEFFASVLYLIAFIIRIYRFTRKLKTKEEKNKLIA